MGLMGVLSSISVTKVWDENEIRIVSALLLLTILKLRSYAKHKNFAIISVISKMSGSNFVVCTVLPLLCTQHN